MSATIPTGFRGLRWQPADEQDVVLLFGRLLDHLPQSLVIEGARTGFPDCKATDSENGQEIFIEFELMASHFYRDHSHRRERCDWIVCWHNDLENPPAEPRIVALDEIVARSLPGLILNVAPSGSSQADAFQLRQTGLSQHHQGIISRLLDFGATPPRQIVWPETNGACFTIRGPLADLEEVEYFKVSATGRLGIPFSRWGRVADLIKEEITNDVNRALGGQIFTGTGKTDRDLAELFTAADSVERFVAVWQRVKRANSACSRQRRVSE